MFWTISLITFVLWFLGVASGASLGLWVHLLLTASIVTLLLAVLEASRRREPSR